MIYSTNQYFSIPSSELFWWSSYFPSLFDWTELPNDNCALLEDLILNFATLLERSSLIKFCPCANAKIFYSIVLYLRWNCKMRPKTDIFSLFLPWLINLTSFNEMLTFEIFQVHSSHRDTKHWSDPKIGFIQSQPTTTIKSRGKENLNSKWQRNQIEFLEWRVSTQMLRIYWTNAPNVLFNSIFCGSF